MSLGIFRDGRLIEAVDGPADAGQTERAYVRMHALAPPGLASGYEVLRICPNHPERSVVDCDDCDPEES